MVKLMIDGVNHFEENTLTDQQYADIDWESSADDTLQYWNGNGTFHFHKLSEVLYARAEDGSPPGPGGYPGYLAEIKGRDSAVVCHISEITRDAIIPQLSGPGSEDTLITFSTLEGDTVRVWTRNVEHWDFVSDSLVIPEP